MIKCTCEYEGNLIHIATYKNTLKLIKCDKCGMEIILSDEELKEIKNRNK